MKKPDKYQLLIQWFEKLDQAAVAFSGGVDSTFVLAVAKKVLGNKVMALTVSAPYIPEMEIKEAIQYCSQNNIEHQVVNVEIIPEILHNPVNRCYLCKHHIFSMLKNTAVQHGYIHLLEGTNADDSGTYRPGLIALRELEIKSPLLENRITKAEVRSFSANMNLPTAEKPSYGCLLTRLPYNYEIKYEELRRIEKAERYLASFGFTEARVRNHGDLARIEIEKNRIAELAITLGDGRLVAYFHKLGYEFVSVDLEGYRSGSFDKNINQLRS